MKEFVSEIIGFSSKFEVLTKPLFSSSSFALNVIKLQKFEPDEFLETQENEIQSKTKSLEEFEKYLNLALSEFQNKKCIVTLNNKINDEQDFHLVAEKITINHQDLSLQLKNKFESLIKEQTSQRKKQVFTDLSVSNSISDCVKTKQWIKNGKIVSIMENGNLRIAFNNKKQLIIFKFSYLLLPMIGPIFQTQTLLYFYQNLYQQNVECILDYFEEDNNVLLGCGQIKLMSQIDKDIKSELFIRGIAIITDYGELELENDKLMMYNSLMTTAQEKQLGIWKNKTNMQQLMEDSYQFRGTLIEVKSGNHYIVLNEQTQKLVNISLKLVECPNVFTTLGWKAKEFVREKFIGSKVFCIIDEDKQSLLGSEQETIAEVWVADGKKLAKIIIEEGYGKTGKNNSELYQLQYNAMKDKIGIFSDNTQEALVDQTAFKNNKGLRFFYQELVAKKRVKKMKVIVQQVYECNYFKLWVDEFKYFINFALFSVELFSKVIQNEKILKLNQDGQQFSYFSLINQNATIDITHFHEEKSIFYGNLIYNEQNFCQHLLEKGFVYLVEDPMNFNYNYDLQLRKTQEYSQKQKIGIWQFEEILSFKQSKQDNCQSLMQNQSLVNQKFNRVTHNLVIVTEILGLNKFCLCYNPDQLEEISRIIQEFITENRVQKLQGLIENNTNCLAFFDDDQSWYRAKVLHQCENNKYKVKFIDYGNTEILERNDLRQMPMELLQYQQQAVECELAFVQLYECKNEENQNETKELFHQLVWNLDLEVESYYFSVIQLILVISIKNKIQYVMLSLIHGDSINYLMLKNGAAMMRKHQNCVQYSFLEEWEKIELQTRIEKKGIWKYEVSRFNCFYFIFQK